MFVYIQEDMTKIAKDDAPWAVELAVKTRRIEKIFLSLISNGVVGGVFRSDLDPTLGANAIFGMFSWTHRWFTPGKHFDAKAISESFSRIFFEGINAR